MANHSDLAAALDSPWEQAILSDQPKILSFLIFVFEYASLIFFERGREGRRNISSLPLARPLPGIEPKTQPCDLTGNLGDLSVHAITLNQEGQDPEFLKKHSY